MQIPLPEIETIEKWIINPHPLVRVERLSTVSSRGLSYPIYGIQIGSSDRAVPTLGIFGGVHGLERIGSQVINSFLESLIAMLRWDKTWENVFQNVRLVSIPVVNPAGMALNWRANPNGVDLMRNAPVDAEPRASFLVGGHRLGPWLPWYRGVKGAPMEHEAQILCDFVKRECLSSRFSIAMDFLSGFGLGDQVWYPWAKTRADFPEYPTVLALQNLLIETYPKNVYRVEPQALNYITNGDLWDYLYQEHYDIGRSETHKFLPLTLEMGSWIWLRKNPRQLFSSHGLFNPILPHRHHRILRRHLVLIDFLLRACLNFDRWNPK
jgi:hypothetical protein